MVSSDDLQEALAELSDWHVEDDKLTKEFVFVDFKEAMEFVNDVASLAESAQHHPDIDIRYSNVKLALSTHDAGGVVTKKDIDLANKIEDL